MSTTRVTKSSKQGRLDAMAESAEFKSKFGCPECGKTTLGGYHLEQYGFLWLKTRKVTSCKCNACLCEWEVVEEVKY